MSVKYSSTGIRHVTNGEAVNETVLNRPSQDLETRSNEVQRAVNLNETIETSLFDYVISTGGGTASIQTQVDQGNDGVAIPGRGYHHRLDVSVLFGDPGYLAVVGKSGEFELRVPRAALESHYSQGYTNPNQINYPKENFLAHIDPTSGGQVTGSGNPYKDPSTCIVLTRDEYSTALASGRGEGFQISESQLKKLPLYNEIEIDIAHLVNNQAQGGFLDRNGAGGSGTQLFAATADADGFYAVLDRTGSNYDSLYVHITSVTDPQNNPDYDAWHAKGFRGGSYIHNAVRVKDYLKVTKATNTKLVLEPTSGTRGNCFGHENYNVALEFFTRNTNLGQVEQADGGHLFEKTKPVPMDLTDKIVIPLVTLVSEDKFVFGGKTGTIRKPQAAFAANSAPFNGLKLPLTSDAQFSGTAQESSGADLIGVPDMTSGLSGLNIAQGSLTQALQRLLSLMSTRDITHRHVVTEQEMYAASGNTGTSSIANPTFLLPETTPAPNAGLGLDEYVDRTRMREITVTLMEPFETTFDPIGVYVSLDQPGSVGVLGYIDPLVAGTYSFSLTTYINQNGNSVSMEQRMVTAVGLTFTNLNNNGSGKLVIDLTMNFLPNMS